MQNNALKRIAALITAALFAAPALFSCTEGGQTSQQPGSDDPQISEVSEMSVPQKWESKDSVSLRGKSYALSGVNAEPQGEGIYYFSREYGCAAPGGQGEYTDCAVCAGIVAEVTKNAPAVIPETGFVVRFCGVSPESEPETGDAARCSFDNHPYLPARYVRCGDVSVGIGYSDIVRIDDDTGFLFDGGWYAATTFGNPYCTEVAVGADGTVVQVNPSGTADSGDTPIPEGGYVIAAGQGSNTEKQLLKLNVGDKAEYREEERIFTVEKYAITEKDPASRPDHAAVLIYGSGKHKTTPAGSWLTEIAVSASGKVTEIRPYCDGGTAVPEGGFVVSGSGKYTQIFGYRIALGDKAVIGGPKSLYFINNAQSVYERCSERLAEAETAYSLAAARLDYIDFKKAKEAIAEARAALLPGGEKPAAGEELYKSISDALPLLDECETELIPCVPVGDRAAWVTVGEDDYDGKPYLHYTNDEAVLRTVKYAKSLNINTLIIDDTASGYAVYPSEVPGLLPHPELNGFDVIASFLNACKSENIRLTVMMSSLAAVTAGREFPQGHYMNLYAGKIMKTNRGRTVDAYGAAALDPSWPEVRAFKLAEAKEIARKYPGIYGIQFDYIRYPLPVYYQAANYEDFGYDSPASQSFAAKYGKDPKSLSIEDPLWDEWCAVRRAVITDTARAYSEELRAINPGINLSFTCFADKNDRAKYVMQEPELWAEKGYADAIYPMIYGDTTAYQRRYAEEIAPAEDYAAVVLGVGSYVKMTQRSMAEQLYMPFELGYEGTSNFTLRYISVCGYHDTVKKAFREPAVPSGDGENTVKAVADMLCARCEALKYLYPCEKGLDEYAQKIKAAAAESGLSAVAEIFSGIEFKDKFLASTLSREAEYADKLISRS